MPISPERATDSDSRKLGKHLTSRCCCFCCWLASQPANPHLLLTALRHFELLIPDLDLSLSEFARILRQLSALQRSSSIDIRLAAESAFDRLISEFQLRTLPAEPGFVSQVVTQE